MGCTANVPHKNNLNNPSNPNPINRISPNSVNKLDTQDFINENKNPLNSLLSKNLYSLTERVDLGNEISTNKASVSEKILFAMKIAKINDKLALNFDEVSGKLSKSSMENLNRILSNSNTAFKKIAKCFNEKENNYAISRIILVLIETYHFLVEISKQMDFEDQFWWKPLNNEEFIAEKLEEISTIIRESEVIFTLIQRRGSAKTTLTSATGEYHISTIEKTKKKIEEINLNAKTFLQVPKQSSFKQIVKPL